MNGQQPNWEDLINRSAQGYNANSSFDRESFRRDLAAGIEQGILGSMTYSQRMDVARGKCRMAWNFFCIMSCFLAGVGIKMFIESPSESLAAAIKAIRAAGPQEWVMYGLCSFAVVYSVCSAWSFIRGFFAR